MSDWRTKVTDPIWVRDKMAPYLLKLMGSRYYSLGGADCGTKPCINCDAIWITYKGWDEECAVALPTKLCREFYVQGQDQDYPLHLLSGNFRIDMLAVSKWMEVVMYNVEQYHRDDNLF